MVGGVTQHCGWRCAENVNVTQQVVVVGVSNRPCYITIEDVLTANEPLATSLTHEDTILLEAVTKSKLLLELFQI